MMYAQKTSAISQLLPEAPLTLLVLFIAGNAVLLMLLW
jgi:hypothetical protein